MIESGGINQLGTTKRNDYTDEQNRVRRDSARSDASRDDSVNTDSYEPTRTQSPEREFPPIEERREATQLAEETAERIEANPEQAQAAVGPLDSDRVQALIA